MGEIDARNLEKLFAAVGARLTQTATLHVLGGSALILLGSSRRTRDFDFVGNDLPHREPDELRDLLDEVAAEMKIGIEAIPFDEFVPVPRDAETRHRHIGQSGKLTVYVFDPYSIALSKIERGFKTDLEDVRFLIRKNIISLPQLETIVNAVLPRAREFDMDASQMRARLAALRRQRGH